LGLDAVELVMTIEEKFRIRISDHEAQEATTPGKLADLVLIKVTASEQPSCLSSRAFYRLRRRGMDEFKLPRKAFSPNTPLDDIVPKHARKQSWDGLKRAVGAAVWPELCRPRPLLYGLAIAVLVVFGVSGVLVGHSAGSWNLALVCALAVAVIAGWLAALATRPLKLAFPPGYQSAGDLVHFLVARNPGLFQIENDTSTRERVWFLVRDIIIEQTGVTDFTKDSHFVRDIHLD
jgi:hypothetical protein